MYQEQRTCDRKVHYTMKTPRSAPPPSHSSTHYRTKTCTPVTSPRALAHSMGQARPPRLSPGTTKSRPSSGSAQEVRTSSPSYFGLVVEQSTESRDSAAGPRDNWSPPSSSVKSFAAAIPKPALPIEANPAYDAFRMQADANHHGRTFTLNAAIQGRSPKPTPQTTTETSTSALATPAVERRPVPASSITIEPPVPATDVCMPLAPSLYIPREKRRPNLQLNLDAGGARMPIDSKRKHESTPEDTGHISNKTVHESVPTTTSEYSKRHPCLSAIYGKLQGSPRPSNPPRAPTEQCQPKVDTGIEMLEVVELEKVLEESTTEKFALLLLDVRVATYYATSRIKGALNLCIPTTLLKRATFNLKKMQHTFAYGEQATKFSCWRDVRYIVVYDSSSTETRDALAATNMLRKFIGEGYKGHACILRGGFNAFEAAYPNLVDHQSTGQGASGSAVLSLNTSGGAARPAVPAIIGGVVLPLASAAPNPFFSNIRQNMDLADGVGRLDLSIPTALDLSSLPSWLRTAVDPHDHGKRVSERFLRIELAEQARMKHAYAVFNPSAHSTSVSGNVQLSGIEKGGKNRYKDILPFEHARVRLQNRPAGTCDYINASHIRASRSFKRYIASQGPLPATFEDFWSVIWEQDVRVIVMLTAESEGGQLKCHSYWTETEYGPIKLRLLSEKKVSLDAERNSGGYSSSNFGRHADDRDKSKTTSVSEAGRRRANTLATVEGSKTTVPSPASAHQNSGHSGGTHGETPFVIIRKFSLSHSNYPFEPYREVTHLHYPSWPDFGVPAQPGHLLALVELANMMQGGTATPTMPKTVSSAASGSLPGSSGLPGPDTVSWLKSEAAESNTRPRPILVHCSAGCGRTGTFCTVDSVIDMLRRQNQRPTKNSIDKLRTEAGSQRSAGDNMQDVAMPDINTGGSVDIAMSGTDVKGSQVGFAGTEGAMKKDSGNTEWGGVFDPTWLDNDSVDLVAKTVEDFRMQRLSMVQSLRQFVLCYETIAEWVSRAQKGNMKGPGRARSESLRVVR